MKNTSRAGFTIVEPVIVIAAEFMVYESDGRFVAIKNGAAEGVCDSAQEAASSV
jgi:hypothetical protein